jgi:WD40 repeat protein
MRTETYKVQAGTRPIMRTETYKVQTGTRPIVEEKLRNIRGHSAPTNAVCFSGDGLRVLSTGDDCSIFTWDYATGNELQSIPKVHNQKISGITCLTAEQFATCSWDRTIKIWRRDGRLVRTLTIPFHSRFYALAASPDGKIIAGAIGHMKICAWDIETGSSPYPDLSGHTRKVLTLSFFPGAKRLVSGSSDMTVRIWNMNTKHCEKVLYGHSDEVNCVAVSPNGQLIASGGSDGVIFLWDAQTGAQRLRIHARAQEVFALVFSPDAKNLLSGGSDHIMRCWDVHTGREVGHLDGHAGSIRGLAISPDGHYIASCGDDRTVHLWKQEKM